MARSDKGPAALIRPTLPATYVVPEKSIVGVVVFSVVVAFVGVAIDWACVNDSDMTVWARILLGLLGLLFVLLAGFGLTQVTRSVTVHDDGLVVRTLGSQRTVPWQSVKKVTFSFASKDRQASGGRAAIAGAIVGGVVGGAISGSLAQGGGPDHRQGNPFADGRLRRDYEPSASVSDSTGKRSTHFSGSLGWAFFTALFAESVARGAEVDVVAIDATAALPRRR